MKNIKITVQFSDKEYEYFKVACKLAKLAALKLRNDDDVCRIFNQYFYNDYEKYLTLFSNYIEDYAE